MKPKGEARPHMRSAHALPLQVKGRRGASTDASAAFGFAAIVVVRLLLDFSGSLEPVACATTGMRTTPPGQHGASCGS